MEKIETLKDWFIAMISANLDNHINLKTAKFMNEILNGGTKDTYVVFDNMGGMVFSIWKVDKKDLLLYIEGPKALREDLIFGYVIGGVSTLTDYQKEYPHWSLQKKEKTEYTNFK